MSSTDVVTDALEALHERSFERVFSFSLSGRASGVLLLLLVKEVEMALLDLLPVWHTAVFSTPMEWHFHVELLSVSGASTSCRGMEAPCWVRRARAFLLFS